MTAPKAPSRRAARNTGTADHVEATWNLPSGQVEVSSFSFALLSPRKHLGRDSLVYAK